MKTSTLIVALLAAILLAGCAQKRSLYDWQEYDRKLYGLYKDPTTSQAFVLALETQVRAAEQSGLRPPPGIYAEIGTLYLESGDAKTATSYYQKESAAWPESAPLMKQLIAALDRASGAKK